MRLQASEQAERIGWSIKGWNRLVFVTATLPQEEQDPKVISSCWTDFIRLLRMRRFPGLRVIRVLQKHPGGHGWHVHALFDRYVNSRILLSLAAACGLGRMDFRVVQGSDRARVVNYIARYITRDLRKRDQLAKGVRMVTSAGNLNCSAPWWIRVCDITVEQTKTRLFRSLRALCECSGLRVAGATPAQLFTMAPASVLREWRQLNPGYAY